MENLDFLNDSVEIGRIGNGQNADAYPIAGLSRFAKRAIDLAGSIVGLVVLSPIMALIAMAIKFTSPGPVLFKQERLGHKGKKFIFLKFRSMHHKCDDALHQEYMARFIGNHETLADETLFKITEDPRVTPLGRWLRRTSLDELPQLINVFMGEMSLVGPRPPIGYEVERYKPWHARRLEAKPGITGLWQVKGRSALPFDDAVRLDIKYIDDWSIWLDIMILFATCKEVLIGRGAY